MEKKLRAREERKGQNRRRKDKRKRTEGIKPLAQRVKKRKVMEAERRQRKGADWSYSEEDEKRKPERPKIGQERRAGGWASLWAQESNERSEEEKKINVRGSD